MDIREGRHKIGDRLRDGELRSEGESGNHRRSKYGPLALILIHWWGVY